MNHKLESRFLENPKLAKSVEKTEKYLHSIDPLQTIQDTDTVTLSVERKLLFFLLHFLNPNSKAFHLQPSSQILSPVRP